MTKNDSYIATNTSRKDLSTFLGFIIVLYFSLNVPLAVVSGVGVIFGFLFLLLRLRAFHLNFSAFIVIIFAVTYFVLNTYIEYSLFYSFAYLITIIMMYAIGLNFVNDNKSIVISEGKALSAIKMIYYGLSFYVIISIIVTLFTGHTFNSINREPIIFWDLSRGNPTHFGTLSTIPLAISIFILTKHGLKKTLLHICIFSSIVISNILMSNRIIVVYIPLLFFLSLVFKYYPLHKIKANAIIVSSILFLFVGYIIIVNNLFDIQSTLIKIPLMERFFELQEIGYSDPRLSRQIYIIMNFFKYPNGGGMFTLDVGDAHNVWLNIYDYSGWVPFLFFLIFTLGIIRNILFVIRINDNLLLSLLSFVLCSFFISFLIEPVMRSNESYTVVFFFISGLFAYFARYYKERDGQNSMNYLSSLFL